MLIAHLKWPGKIPALVGLLVICFYYPGFTQNEQIKLGDARDIFPLYFNAIESASRGRFDQARPVFERMIQLIPTHQQARLYLKICRDAIDQTIAARVGRDLFTAINRAANYADKDAVNSALERALAERPDYYPSYLCRGQIYEQDSLFRPAEIDYSRAIELQPQVAMSWFFRGNLNLKIKNTDRALEDFNRALKIDKHFVPALLKRGELLAAQNRLNLAYEDLTLAMRLNRNYVKRYHLIEIFNRVAINFMNNGLYDKAIEALDMAVFISPQWAEPFLNRGIAYRKTGRIDPALKDLDRALKLDPGLADGWYNRALLLRDAGRADQAVDNLEKAVRLDPGNLKAWFALGELYSRAKNDSAAISAFDHVIQYDDENVWALYWLAFSYDRLRRFQKARLYYSRFLALIPADQTTYIKKVNQRIEKITRYLRQSAR